MNFVSLPTTLAASRLPLALLAGAALLTACGGGEGGGPAVTSLQATNAMYGRNVVVAVSGSGLSAAGLNAAIEPGCATMTRTNTSDSAQSFTCRIPVTGDLRVRVRNAEGQELAALRLNVEAPRVQINASQSGVLGSFVVELDPAKAPKSVDNFLAYASASPCFFRETLFHRVIANKIVQAGGFKSGLQPTSGVGSAIPLESNNGLKNLRGTIAMARTSIPNSATSQFYININDNPDFDYVSDANPGYAVFGTVVSGMDQLDRLQSVATTTKKVTINGTEVSFADTPVEEVLITACGQIR